MLFRPASAARTSFRNNIKKTTASREGQKDPGAIIQARILSFC